METNYQKIIIKGPRIFTLDDVADLFQVSKMTILRWKKDIWITGFFKIGRRWMILKEDLENAITNQIHFYSKYKKAVINENLV